MDKFLLFVLPAAALAATTQVTQTVRNPDGNLASGRADITISAACRDSSGDYVGTNRPITVKFIGGAFSVNLVPNDTCIPSGTSYQVAWQLDGGTRWSETWIVPTSSTAVSVDAVKASIPPAPYLVINGRQINFSGLADGCLALVGGQLITQTCGSGGGGGGQTWAQESNTWANTTGAWNQQ